MYSELLRSSVNSENAGVTKSGNKKVNCILFTIPTLLLLLLLLTTANIMLHINIINKLESANELVNNFKVVLDKFENNQKELQDFFAKYVPNSEKILLSIFNNTEYLVFYLT